MNEAIGWHVGGQPFSMGVLLNLNERLQETDLIHPTCTP
jgi:hypothetical protein